MSISRYVWVIELSAGLGTPWVLFEIHYSPITAEKELAKINAPARCRKVKLK